MLREVADDRLGKLRTLQWRLYRGFHHAGQVVGDAAIGDGLANAVVDHGGGFVPAEELQHHLPTEDQGAGIDAIQTGVFGGGAVGGLEDGGVIANVGAGGHTQAPDDGRGGIGDIVPVQVEGHQNGILPRSGLQLLKHAIGNAVVHHHHPAPAVLTVGFANAVQDGPHLFADGLLFGGGEVVVAGVDGAGVVFHRQLGISGQVVQHPAFPLRDAHVAELRGGQLVAPVPEGTLGELHDVPLMDQGHVAFAALQPHGMADGAAHMALGAQPAHRLDAQAGAGAKPAVPQFAVGGNHRLVQVAQQLLTHRVVSGPLHTDVDVFRVFPIHHHVEILRAPVGAGGAWVIPAGSHTAVQIKQLPQRHVHRGGEGSFDGDAVLTNGLQGVLRQVLQVPVDLTGLVTGIDLEPDQTTLGAIGSLHGSVQHHPETLLAGHAVKIQRGGKVRGHGSAGPLDPVLSSHREDRHRSCPLQGQRRESRGQSLPP